MDPDWLVRLRWLPFNILLRDGDTPTAVRCGTSSWASKGAMNSRENWVGLESNPAVMTQYAQKLGVSESWAFSDCWGLEEEALRYVPKPCVGCIFLYPFSQVEARKRALGTRRGCEVAGVWHMRQLVGNACGAVAIMHTVMNTLDRVGSDAGFLKEFGQNTKASNAQERGKLFAPALRQVHSELASQGQTAAPRPNADLEFHFVSLVEVQGRLYELDGNNDGPLDIGPVGADGFLSTAVRHVKEAYIAPFPDSHFSLITLGPKPPDENGSN